MEVLAPTTIRKHANRLEELALCLRRLAWTTEFSGHKDESKVDMIDIDERIRAALKMLAQYL